MSFIFRDLRNGSKLLIGLAAALLLAGSAPLAGAVPIANPGFETGDFTDWNPVPDAFGSLFFVLAGGGHSGTYGAFFGGATPGFDSISQSFATTPGLTYEVSFWLRNFPLSEPSDFRALWDGGVQFDDLNPPAFAYTLQTFDVVATGTSSTLTFASYQVPSFFALDDVAVNSVPEPASVVLVGAGLLGLAWRARRKVGLSE
jgi:hypothetical protein